MLPTGHIEWTWASLNVIQRSTGHFVDADYRLVAVATVLPDLIDKPLAWVVFPDANAALFFGHTLLLNVFLWLFAWATGNSRSWMVYLMAFSSHLLADRMWGFTQTLLWPLRGVGWHQWRHVSSPQEMLNAYLEIIVQEPILLVLEALGLLLLAWFVVDRKLMYPHRLVEFLRNGRPPADPVAVEVES